MKKYGIGKFALLGGKVSDENQDFMATPSNGIPGKLPGEGGFSLVELLVVIAVVGIIAAIAVPNIAEVTRGAQNATLLQNAQNLTLTYNSYVETYFSENGSYPPAPASVAQAIAAMAEGRDVTNQRLNTTMSFRLPGMTANDVATNKIVISDHLLLFVSEN